MKYMLNLMFCLLAVSNAVLAATTPTVVPRVVVSAPSSWGTAADAWAGYTGSLDIWVPTSVTGGWTLRFKSADLGRQVQAGTLWNANASYDAATQFFTITSPAWGGEVAANSVINTGFNGSGFLNTAIVIQSCTFNDQPCVASAMTVNDAKTTLDAAVAGNVVVTPTPTPAPVPAPAPSPTPAPLGKASLEVLLSVSSDWNGGYSGNVVVKNLSSASLPAGANGWRATLKFPDAATAKDVFKAGPWNFDVAFGADGAVTLAPKSWSSALAAGDVTSSGFNGGVIANLQKAASADANITVLFTASAAGGSGSVVTPVAPAPVPVPVDGTQALPTGAVSGGLLFSPYKDMGTNLNWNTNLMSTTVSGALQPILQVLPAKTPAVTWAFATGECGQENWAGVKPDVFAQANVKAFVDANKNYIISTGGAAGAFTCKSVTGMRTFINRYASNNLVGLDFDIEAGQSASDIDSIVQQLAAVQAEYPGLRFSFTVATLGSTNGQSATSPYGDLNVTGYNVMRALIKYPLNNYTVNLMVMDFGGASAGVCVVAGNLCDMGQTAIQAAKNFSAKYGVPYSRIELTPMIGMNDVKDEIFSLKDADVMVSWALANKLAGVHFWSVDRDAPCSLGYASPVCSSVSGVNAWGYTQQFIKDLGL